MADVFLSIGDTAVPKQSLCLYEVYVLLKGKHTSCCLVISIALWRNQGLGKWSVGWDSLQRGSTAIVHGVDGTPLQYSCLENPMDGGAWWAAVQGVAESRTRLNNFTFTFHFHALEKEMATHSSDLAWKIPGTGEPGGLPSMGSHRVGYNWSDLAAAAGKV